MLNSAGIADGSSVNQVLLQFSTSAECSSFQKIATEWQGIMKQIPLVQHRDQKKRWYISLQT